MHVQHSAAARARAMEAAPSSLKGRSAAEIDDLIIGHVACIVASELRLQSGCCVGLLADREPRQEPSIDRLQSTRPALVTLGTATEACQKGQRCEVGQGIHVKVAQAVARASLARCHLH